MPTETKTPPRPCAYGQALLERIETLCREHDIDVTEPVEDQTEDPVVRKLLFDPGRRWAEHYGGCASCRPVFFGLARQVSRGDDPDWRTV